MTKQLRNIVITVGIVVVLAAAFFILTKTPLLSNTSSSSSSGVNLLASDSSKINSIKVTNKVGSYTILKADKDTWTVKELEQAPVDTSAVESAVSGVTGMTASKVISESASDAAKYGLEKPQLKIEVALSDGTAKTLEVGNADPLGNGNYVRVEGTDKIYVSSSDYSGFMTNDYKYVVVSLVAVDNTNDAPYITKLDFAGSKRTAFEIVPMNSSSSSSTSSSVSTSTQEFKILYPSELDADTTKVSTLLKGLVSVNAEDVVSLDVSKENLAKYGLDNPLYTFGYTLRGETKTLLFGKTFTQDSKSYVYVMLQGRKVIYKIQESTLSFYKYGYTDLASRLLFLDNINSIKTVTISNGSQSWVFQLSGDSDNLNVTWEGKKITDLYFRHLYQELVGLEVEGTAARPSGGSTYCTFKFDYKSASHASNTFHFIVMNAEQCFWDYNGSGEFYVLKPDLDKIIRDAQTVSENKDIVIYQ